MSLPLPFSRWDGVSQWHMSGKYTVMSNTLAEDRNLSAHITLLMNVDHDIFWERKIVRLLNYNSLCVTALRGESRFSQHNMWSLVIIDCTKQRSAVGVYVGGTIMKSAHSHRTTGVIQYKQSQASQINADILSHDSFKYSFTTVSFLVLFIFHIFILFPISFL